jgi:hypothetical protein
MAKPAHKLSEQQGAIILSSGADVSFPRSKDVLQRPHKGTFTQFGITAKSILHTSQNCVGEEISKPLSVVENRR